MNGTGVNRYRSGWEKLSKRMRLLYPCAICGENSLELKECHHIDENKRNTSPENSIVLCLECHAGVHNGTHHLPDPLPSYCRAANNNFKIDIVTTRYDWFNPALPIKLIFGLNPEIAMQFRRSHVKGFIRPGGCNFYIGLQHNEYLVGVMGFSNPDFGSYHIMLKADTTPQAYEYSTDLLLYCLRTKQVQEALEKKFNREIRNAYSMCFSQHDVINRYRKHGELVKKVPVKGGYNLGYLFQIGDIPTVKAAKSMWMQKHNIK